MQSQNQNYGIERARVEAILRQAHQERAQAMWAMLQSIFAGRDAKTDVGDAPAKAATTAI